MSTLISVSKGYHHGMSERHWRAKRHYYASYLDENGKYSKKRVSKIKAFILKFQVYHRLTIHCTGCGLKFLKLARKKSNKVECPFCDTLG